VVTAVLGEWLDSGVIFGVVLIIVIIGFVQEGRAARALEAVRGMLAPKARVLRGGQEHRIPAEEVVAGDIVVLQAGDRVPADIRLIHTKKHAGSGSCPDRGVDGGGKESRPGRGGRRTRGPRQHGVLRHACRRR
jgi:high-affinity K+ transport system ATPase subunit B